MPNSFGILMLYNLCLDCVLPLSVILYTQLIAGNHDYQSLSPVRYFHCYHNLYIQQLSTLLLYFHQQGREKQASLPDSLPNSDERSCVIFVPDVTVRKVLKVSHVVDFIILHPYLPKYRYILL